MPYSRVQQPLVGAEAFRQLNERAVQSQAAILLLLGRQLRGDDPALTARATARGLRKAAVADAETLAEFPVPQLRGTSARFQPEATRAALARRFGETVSRFARGQENPKSWARAYADLGEALYQAPSVEIAAELMELCLSHPDELTRVAAAASYFSLSTAPKELIDILAKGTRSQEPLVRDVAATALARIAPDHASVRRLSTTNPPKGGREPAHTSTLVHGTFAAGSDWWQPGGDFHKYLLTHVRSDLYQGADRFGWSGGYSDGARAIAAADLVGWVTSHNLNGLDLFGHSHGANVMMLATQLGLRAGKLILLSCPVHVHQYLPDIYKVARVVSIRVKLDLVILADRGGQRFTHPQIEENVLPIWFKHSATHEPAVWKKHKLPTVI